MTDWIRFLRPTGDPDTLAIMQLAWLGDAVWELHQRIRLCQTPAKLNYLHSSAVSEVRAEAQAGFLDVLEEFLSDDEIKLLKKARNKVGRGSRKVDPVVYARATGFETLIGWLFLKNPSRLDELFDQLDQVKFQNT